MGTYRTACKLLMWAGRARDALEDAKQGYRRARELGLEREVAGRGEAAAIAHCLGTGQEAAPVGGESRAAPQAALPAIAGPGLAEQPTQRDDRLRQREPELCATGSYQGVAQTLAADR
jgi:hypothetical protein